MKSVLPMLLAAATACSATHSTPPRTSASGISSPRADFARYQTFSFGPANPPPVDYKTTERSLEVQGRLALLVQASLQGRGYRQSAENADLVIKVSAGAGALPDHEIKSYGPTKQVPAGFIGIDAYDGTSGVGVWHGAAFAEIDPERVDDGLLSRGVEGMLASFPVRD